LSLEGAEHLPPAGLLHCFAKKRRRPWKSCAPVKSGLCRSPIPSRCVWTGRAGQIPNPLARPDLVRVGGRTCEVTADTIEQALDRLP
jgi:hypothetical protein